MSTNSTPAASRAAIRRQSALLAKKLEQEGVARFVTFTTGRRVPLADLSREVSRLKAPEGLKYIFRATEVSALDSAGRVCAHVHGRVAK
jgi:hypothetical protein